MGTIAASALTTVNIVTISKERGDRVVVRFRSPEMRQFLHDNRIELWLPKSRKFTLLYDATPNKQGQATKDGCPIPTDLVPELLRMVKRCADEITGERTKKSLATVDQLSRLYQLIDICSRQKDNWVSMPVNFYSLTLGQAGRMIRDLKVKLEADGLWDEASKREIVKEVKRR